MTRPPSARLTPRQFNETVDAIIGVLGVNMKARDLSPELKALGFRLKHTYAQAHGTAHEGVKYGEGVRLSRGGPSDRTGEIAMDRNEDGSLTGYGSLRKALSRSGENIAQVLKLLDATEVSLDKALALVDPAPGPEKQQRDKFGQSPAELAEMLAAQAKRREQGVA